MSLSIAELILRTRKLTNDPPDPGDHSITPKWADPDYCRAIQSFIDRLVEDQPECLLQADGTMVDKPAIPTDGSGDFPVGDHYWEDCTFYMAWSYYSADSEDTRDQKQADKYWALMEHVGGENEKG